MGIMDNLMKNEEKFNNSGYEKQEKDLKLINNHFGLTKEKQEFNMTVKFLAFDDIFPEYEGMLTRKIHYALFDKKFREENEFDIKSLGVVADVKSHGFDTYNVLEDLKWSFWNAFKGTGEEKWKNLSNKVQESTESYVYIYVVDSSNTELIGKVFLYKIPIKVVKDDYIFGQWNKFQIDVFGEDVYCRIDAKGYGRDTKWTASTDENKKTKGVSFTDILKKNGQTEDDVKDLMRDVDISRYDFKQDEELEKMEKIADELETNLSSVWSVVTAYSKGKLKGKGGVKSVNTSSIKEEPSDEPKQFVISNDGDEDEDGYKDIF